MCSQALHPVGTKAMFLFAAAVSDFYVAPDKQLQHKIQSRDGPLTLELDQVPKTLGILRDEWAPEGYFVSFKLETDHDILISKAKQAIEKYRMNIVVANELHSRYKKVFLVTREKEVVIERSCEEDIEIDMITALVTEHSRFAL